MIKTLYLVRSADRRLVVKATMRSFEVVVVGPGREGEVALVRVGPVSSVGPFAQSGLDEAFALPWFAVSKDECGVFQSHLETNLTKLVGAIATAVIGEQGANGDAMASEKSTASLRKAMVVWVF